MKTVKLYQKDVYQRTCRTKVLEAITDPKAAGLDISSKENPLLVVLEESVFFPEGGGQPSDTGYIGSYPVSYVFERGGTVYHRIALSDIEQKDLRPVLNSLVPGREITAVIDWERRFRHMQMHCGEHILSGMFYQEFGGVNRGFHLGEDYMTIDISLEEIPDYKEMTDEMLTRAEALTNEAIWSNAPVTTRYFDSKEEAENLPLRKALAVDEEISIVCVGSPENPADCVACCGTHPATAGQVGLVKIVKAESYKGMTRLYVKAGSVALADYRKKHEIAQILCKRYSTEAEQLLDRIKVQEDKNAAVRKELYDLKKSVMSGISEEIGNALVEQSTARSNGPAKGNSLFMLIREYDYLNTDDLQTLGRQLTPYISGLLILIAAKENTAILFSKGKPDCGKLVRDNAPIYQGKGGGNDTCARAIFSKRESLDTYLDLIEKHLR